MLRITRDHTGLNDECLWDSPRNIEHKCPDCFAGLRVIMRWEEHMPQITREGNTVRIERVPKLSWKTNTQNCFAGSLSAALSVTDHPVSERELNGLTALAFRSRWLYYTGKPRWCPSCPVGECGEEINAVCRNVGWQIRWQDKLNPADAVASIDRGMPVMVYDDKWNPALAYGYADAGQRLLIADYFGGDGWHDTARLPPFVIYIQGYGGTPDRKAAILDALKMATVNWHTDHKWNGAADYWYGRSAYDHWIHDVREAKDSPDGNPFFVTWWNMDVLCEARQQAAHWLADITPLFDAPAAAHLCAASEFYMQEHRKLWRSWGEDNDFSADPAKWTDPKHGQRIAEVLTQARDMESQAVTELEAVLAPSA